MPFQSMIGWIATAMAVMLGPVAAQQLFDEGKYPREVLDPRFHGRSRERPPIFRVQAPSRAAAVSIVVLDELGFIQRRRVKRGQ